MKKILALILALSMLFIFTACGEDKNNSSYSDTQPSTEEATSTEVAEEATTAESYEEYLPTEPEEPTVVPTTEPDEPIVTPPLSQNCDRIVYTVTDGEDYYELVVNEEVAYPKTTYQFGVIKNNEWLVEMSSQSPLLNDDNSWKFVGYGIPLEEIRFEYLGEGCFLYYSNDNAARINESIFYNPSTSVSLVVLNISRYDSLENIVNEGEIIVLNESFEWILLNTNTGETTSLGGHFKELEVMGLQSISEGLFMARLGKWSSINIIGFFNRSGELIIDITEYGCHLDKTPDYRFHNGQCSFITYNDTGVPFMITIDNTGEVISQEQIEN